MLKIYASRQEELRLLPLLAEFRARVITNYPIKGRTRKIAHKNAYKVTDFPTGHEYTPLEKELGDYYKRNPDLADEL